jgi:hypothetical protein
MVPSGRDLNHSEAVLARTRDQPAEILERAEVGMDRLVASLGAADRPRAADVVRPGVERVVRAFAMAVPDRMDRREVEHVESHPGDVGQARLAVAERAVPPRLRARRAGKHLVPRGIARALAVDHDRELPVVGRRGAPVGVARGERRRLLGHAEAPQLRGVGGARELLPGQAQARGVLGAGAVRGPREQERADARGRREVGVHAPRELRAPRQERVHPARDRVAVAPDARDRELAAPAVVAERQHGRLAPVGLGFVAVEQAAHDHIVAVGERVGFHRDPVADDALRRKAAAIHFGLDALDDDPHPPVARRARRLDRRRHVRGLGLQPLNLHGAE